MQDDIVKSKPYVNTRRSNQIRLRSGAFYDTFRPQALAGPRTGPEGRLLCLPPNQKGEAPSIYRVARDNELGFTGDPCFPTPVSKTHIHPETRSGLQRLPQERLGRSASKSPFKLDEIKSGKKVGFLRPNGIRKARKTHKKIVSFKVSAKRGLLSRSNATLSSLARGLRDLQRKQRREKKKNSNSNLAPGCDSTYDTCLSEVSSVSTTASVIHAKPGYLGFTNPSTPAQEISKRKKIVSNS